MQAREFMYWLSGYLERGKRQAPFNLAEVIDINQKIRTVPGTEVKADMDFITSTRQKIRDVIVFQPTPTDPISQQYDKLQNTLRKELGVLFGEVAEAPKAAANGPKPKKKKLKRAQEPA
jgi:hypothetical protein